jgi:hypothetical protein
MHVHVFKNWKLRNRKLGKDHKRKRNDNKLEKERCKSRRPKIWKEQVNKNKKIYENLYLYLNLSIPNNKMRCFWEWIFVARATERPFFKTLKIIQTFHKKVETTYQDLDNILIYQCVDFQNNICCILGLPKITNLDFVLVEE